MTRTLASLLLATAACSEPASTTDELAGETAADDVAADGKLDSSAADAYTYFAIRTDLRKCMSPMCGGFFVSRVNRSITWCHDGTAADSCYTPALDWRESGLTSDAQQKLLDASFRGDERAIVRGHFEDQTYPSFGNLGQFVVTEAWVAENATPAEGVFVKIATNGIVCIMAPCPTLTEKALNTIRFANISQLDWTMSDLSDREIQGFVSELKAPGVIAAGWRYYTVVNGQWTPGRAITAAYHRL